jgi:hypothetical protein
MKLLVQCLGVAPLETKERFPNFVKQTLSAGDKVATLQSKVGPILKKGHFYRHRNHKNPNWVDVVPLEDREVSYETYRNYVEIEYSEVKKGKWYEEDK